jgi:hypothetical protein
VSIGSSSVVLALLVACHAPSTTEPPDGTTRPDGTTTAAGAFQVVGASSLPNQWTPAEGWFIAAYAPVVGDLTGDGVADAIVSVGPVGRAATTTLLVAGPLMRALTVPGDEATSFGDCGFMAAGDASGDGRTDIFVQCDSNATNYLVTGPVSGEIDPIQVGQAFPAGTYLSDLDADGILDIRDVSANDSKIRITWGPSSRWGAAPDLTILVSCPGVDDDLVDGTFDHLRATGDLDGDGRRQIWFEDGGKFCTWTFPLPSAGGDYDPTTDPAARMGIREFSEVPDQTGDGLPDLWTGWNKTVHPAAVAFGADGEIASDAVIAAATDLYSVYPIPYDLTGDGVTDFIGLDAQFDESDVGVVPTDPVSGEILVVIPGGAALASPTFDRAWDVEGYTAGMAFLENGTAGVLISGEGKVIAVDVGLGTVP